MGSTSQTTPFGKPMLDHFLLDKNYKNLNHGSYGTYPKPVQTALRRFQDLAEAAPDKFMRYQYAEHLLASRTAIANLLNAPPETCVFVQNATLGINTVLRNLVYERGDVIVYFDTIYGACENTIVSIVETDGNVQARKVEGYELPCEHEEIVQRFVEVVEGLKGEGLRAKVAVFETICALPGVRFPFERLTEECRRLGILSCIDGAHGVGQIPLDLGKLDPDFFVSNCHKWLLTPRGCALFHVPTRNHHLIRTTFPTSHGFIPLTLNNANPIKNPLPEPSSSSKAAQATPFTILFAQTATADNSPYYCVPAALDFRAQVCGGEDSVMAYLRESAKQGGDVVARMLGTGVMEDRDGGRLRDCAFANVCLPIRVLETGAEGEGRGGEVRKGEEEIQEEDVGTVVNYIQSTLVKEFGTFVSCFGYKGRVWARLSGMVYLEEEDWEWCGDVLGRVCERVVKGEWKVGEEGVREKLGKLDLDVEE